MYRYYALPDSFLINELKKGKFSKRKFVPVQDADPKIYEEGTRVGFKRKNRGSHIDYIFVTEEFEVKNVTIVKDSIDDKFPSDHYPLLAELKFK